MNDDVAWPELNGLGSTQPLDQISMRKHTFFSSSFITK